MRTYGGRGGGGYSVGDRQRDTGNERLTERDREALQELARAIVREAGMIRDPEQEADEKNRKETIEAGREHWKAQVDFFKHLSTVSGAALIAVTAVTGVLQLEFKQPEFKLVSVFLVIAVAGFLWSALAALIFLWMASERLAWFSWGRVLPTRQLSDEFFSSAGKSLKSDFSRPRAVSYFLFGIGISALTTAAISGYSIEGHLWPSFLLGF
jgi:hypothetical protein